MNFDLKPFANVIRIVTDPSQVYDACQEIGDSLSEEILSQIPPVNTDKLSTFYSDSERMSESFTRGSRRHGEEQVEDTSPPHKRGKSSRLTKISDLRNDFNKLTSKRDLPDLAMALFTKLSDMISEDEAKVIPEILETYSIKGTEDLSAEEVLKKSRENLVFRDIPSAQALKDESTQRAELLIAEMVNSIDEKEKIPALKKIAGSLVGPLRGFMAIFEDAAKKEVTVSLHNAADEIKSARSKADIVKSLKEMVWSLHLSQEKALEAKEQEKQRNTTKLIA